MFSFRFFITIFIIALSPITYSADILDIYNRALKFNNDLKIISNNNEISKEKYNQTSSSLFPDIGISASTQEINTNKYEGAGVIGDYASETATLKITQPLLRIYFFDELNKAEANIKKSQIEISNYKKDLIIKSAELYFSLINSNNKYKVELIKNEIMLLKYNNAKKLFSNGYITDIELNKHKNNFNITSIELDVSLNELELIRQDIYIFTGREALDIHDLDTITDIPFITYEVESLISKAITSFDSIKLALLDIDISKHEMKSNRSQHYPTVDLIATYDYSDTSSGSRLGRTTRESNTIGLTINFPIYQGGYQSSKVEESRYKYKNAKVILDQLRRSIKRDITDKVNNHNLLKKLIVANKNRYSDANLDYLTIENGFQSGLYTNVELKDSEYRLIIAKHELISNTLKYLLTDLELKKYSSELNIGSIKDINQMLVW
jgi:outer membrane protein